MLDSLTTTVAAVSTIPIQPVAIGGTGAIILVMLINYREVLMSFFKRIIGVGRDEERKQILDDIKLLKDNLDDYTENEAMYWADNEKRLVKLETDAELNKQQAKGQHEETLRILAQQNERLGDLNDSVKMLTQTLLTERK